MCHLVFFSTDSDEDFLQAPTDDFRIETPGGDDLEAIRGLLAYPNVWYMGCRYGGCSCHFCYRFTGYEPPLGPHEDWMGNEEDDDIVATLGAYRFFKGIIESGHKLDVLSVWDGEIPEVATDVNISVATLPPEHFRFIQDVRFVFGA